jgi:phenylacetaldehyde dehydrogenase
MPTPTASLKDTYAELLLPQVAEFAFRDHQLLIGGQWRQPISGRWLDNVDPGNGRTIGRIADAGAEDVDAAVAAARQAFDKGPWSRLPAHQRGKLLWKLADRIEQLALEFAQLESLDNGKPVSQAQPVDVGATVDRIRYMAGWAGKVNGETVQVHAEGEHHAYTLREPVGVVGAIVPWNYPLLMAIFKVAPALAAGCTVVLKPAEQTSLTALRLGQLFEEVGFPPGVLNVVTGYGETAGAALVKHPHVNKIGFTGSTEVGKKIARTCAVTLELGGKSPVVVFSDADVEAAIQGAAWAIFWNGGQVCTAGSRLYVHRKVYDRFVEGIANVASTLTTGHGLKKDTTFGPLVSSEQYDRVRGYLDIARQEGAKVIEAGPQNPSEGYFVRPTILTDLKPSMRVVREEIFGPVLAALPFDSDEDLDHIASLANDTPFGLAASVWTSNVNTAHRMAARIKAGTVWVNTHNYFDPALAFGGMKESGYGREGGVHALELFTSVKAVVMPLK